MEIFSFGERLMIYRKRAGLSKKELAKRVGISVSTLTKYENDESQPNVDMPIFMLCFFISSCCLLLLEGLCLEFSFSF